jgi:hypothetical protein
MADHESEEDVCVEGLCVEVWMRELSPPPDDPRTAVLSRLREFESDGLVDDVSVRVWGKHVPARDGAADEGGSSVRRRVADFRAWAERNGHSLGPAFYRHERSSMVSAERDEVIRLPLQCLAVYEEGRLVGVFPCSADGETNTVDDCLRRLETGDVVGDKDTG